MRPNPDYSYQVYWIFAVTAASVPVEIRTGPPARSAFDPADVADLNRRFEQADADEIVAWAAARFGSRLVLASSFADTVLIDIVTRTAPDVEVVFCDTGFPNRQP